MLNLGCDLYASASYMLQNTVIRNTDSSSQNFEYYFSNAEMPKNNNSKIFIIETNKCMTGLFAYNIKKTTYFPYLKSVYNTVWVYNDKN